MRNDGRQRAWVSRIDSDQGDLDGQIEQMAGWLRLGEQIKGDTRLFLKPNLTYSICKEGVTTGPVFLEAVVRFFRGLTEDITIVESDGGSHAWSAEEAFSGHRIPELCKKYGVKAMNLTKQARRVVETDVAGKRVAVELPVPLLDESDYFITLPVPKVHLMTKVTLGFKNQWGCLPDVKRLRNHPEFAQKIVAIHKLLKTRLAIFDGKTFLNRSGPMEGDPVQMNLLIAGDVGASSLLCCKLMGINPKTVKHLRVAANEGEMPFSIGDIQVNCADVAKFAKEPFYLERSTLSWVTLMVFHSDLLTRLIYDSSFAKPIHELLYLMRGRPKDFSPKW